MQHEDKYGASHGPNKKDGWWAEENLRGEEHSLDGVARGRGAMHAVLSWLIGQCDGARPPPRAHRAPLRSQITLSDIHHDARFYHIVIADTVVVLEGGAIRITDAPSLEHVIFLNDPPDDALHLHERRL